ncbi:uncharacterized protein LOC135938587 [Cloeon dipterum]|uniref:uncharacterized protein LOC135938587 n=1 Tax=Cloeon dipterum TaxID=197152 RepID=UPI0032209743
MDCIKPKRNILSIKPYKASTAKSNGEAPSESSIPGRFSKSKDTLEFNLDSGSTGNSYSTPKRGLSSTTEVKTPTDKPVVLEEEFSPIELFPYSQSQSAPIVQWDYNAVQRSSRTGLTRRSRPSSGSMPTIPEIKPPKRRTPSPTTEDMPPLKKQSQEGLNALQQHVKALQELVSSDEESSETEEDKLGLSIHQSLFISDKFERSTASPDPFDSAPNEVEIAETKDGEEKEICTLVATVPKLESTPEKEASPVQDMSLDLDESLLIACTEKVEREVRLSQQQQQEVAKPPAVQPAKKTSPKKNSTVSGLQRGRLQNLSCSSPKKKPMSPHKKPVVGPVKRHSDGKEFNPQWMEKIKSATSPLNNSMRASQSSEKSFHRNLFSNSQLKISLVAKNVAGQSNETKKTVTEQQKKEEQIQIKAAKQPAKNVNKSFDPFEDDSFDANLDELDAIEAQALTQLAASQKAPEPAVIKPVQTTVSSIPVKAPPKPMQPFPRHQSASFLPKVQPQLSKVGNSFSKPAFSVKPPANLAFKQQNNLNKPLTVMNKQPYSLQPRNQSVKAQQKPAATTVSNRVQGANPPATSSLKKSPLIRHKSADFTTRAPVATMSSKPTGGAQFLRHRSFEFGKVQSNAQQCTKQEIEMKRLEAKKRLERRKQQSLNV